MAATVTLLGTATFSTTSGTKTVTATPAVDDLIVIVTANTGSTTTTAAPTDNNSSGTYTVVNTAVKATSADTMQIWVRDALIASATSTVFTQAPGTTSGGGLVVLKITGMTRTGASAFVRSAIQSNQAAGGTPAPVLAATPSSLNPIITAVFNATNTANVTARTNYTRTTDLGYNNPATGLNTADIDSGETSATITWGSTSASAFCSIAVEIDSRVTHTTTGALTGQGSTIVGSAQYKAKHTTTGAIAGPGTTLSGTATRFRAHSSSGTLVGPGTTLSGTASHVPKALPHTTTGDLVGPGTTLSGTARRFLAHSASGALIGPGSTVTGSASHVPQIVPHTSTGALVGQGTTLTGAAARFRAHPTTGALIASGAVLTGTAARKRAFASSGALVGQGSVIDGAADHEPQALAHTTIGALVGSGAVLAGQAEKTHFFTATGALVGPGAVISGFAYIGAEVYPAPSDVLAGVIYGPGGAYVGTLAVVTSELRVGVRHLSRIFGPSSANIVQSTTNYPDPSTVLAGIQYGPGGVYVGTLTVYPSELIIGIRSFTGRM